MTSDVVFFRGNSSAASDEYEGPESPESRGLSGGLPCRDGLGFQAGPLLSIAIHPDVGMDGPEYV